MPFSVEDFFTVFALYNEAIWPLQVFAYLVGAISVVCLFFPSRLSTIGITIVLASMWGLNGIGYHWLFFGEINPISWVFAAFFVLQAVLLMASPWLSTDFRISAERDARTVSGMLLIVFATILYPIWGHLSGHSYPSVPVFGVAPCPTTIFTIGVLLMGSWHTSRWLLIIPGIWAAIGSSAAVLLRVPQDTGLVATLVVLLVFGFGRWRGLAYSGHRETAYPSART